MFFPTEDPSGEVADVEVQEIDIEELNAINLGDGESQPWHLTQLWEVCTCGL